MRTKQRLALWFVFFCTLGWVCAGPAIGADGQAPDADQPTDLFADPGTQPDDAVIGQDPSAALEEIPDDQSVRVGSFGQIDLHVKELDLSRVLQLLSIQSQRNIVASRNVAGSVSADLYGVDFYEALDAILQPNGFGYREKGNFIYVYTAAEIQAIEDAERRLVTRIVRLNHLSSADASAFVSPLLSGGGSISVSPGVSSGIQASISDAGENTFSYSDTLIIRDYQENVDEILAVLAELDIRPKQILVEATILQAQLNEDNAFGVDFSILADYTMNSFFRPLSVVDSVISGNVIGDGSSTFGRAGGGEALQSTVGNTQSGQAGFKFGVLQEDYAIFLRALDRVTDTTVIANPKLLVLNRQRADLLVGAKLGYLSTTATETSTTQSVDFLEVGTQLSVRPFAGDDDFIRMEIRPSISDGTTTAIEGVVIPNQTTQEMTTNIMVRNSQTVVLGGLFKEDAAITRNQVPIVGDLPLVGAAFKGYDDNNERSEVIFLIKPTVVKDEVLYAQGESTADHIEMTRLGMREGLLPWSRTRMVACHVRNALKSHSKGNKRLALWWANMALSLNPTSLEARKIKEAITGNRIYWPAGSILTESIDKVIADQLESHASAAAAEAEQAAQFAADTATEQANDDSGSEQVARLVSEEEVAADKEAGFGTDAQASADPALIDAGDEAAADGKFTEETGDQTAFDDSAADQTDDAGFDANAEPEQTASNDAEEPTDLFGGAAEEDQTASTETDEVTDSGDFATNEFDDANATAEADAEGDSDEFAQDDASAEEGQATASAQETDQVDDGTTADETPSVNVISAVEDWLPVDEDAVGGEPSGDATAEVEIDSNQID